MSDAALPRIREWSWNDAPTIIRRKIREEGFCIVGQSEDSASCEAWLLHVAERIGSLITHGDHGPIVWPIKSHGHLSSTYSQHNHEADLHTDGQFLVHPPQVIAMLCERQASCGGGATILLPAADVLAEISKHGRRNLVEYFSNPVPFRVPDAFAAAASQRIVWAPVFEGERIRYRRDTILSAASETLTCSEREVLALRLELLNSYIQKCAKRKTTTLQPGEILFIDNRRMLHGRTGFSDLGRSLWRVCLTIE